MAYFGKLFGKPVMTPMGDVFITLYTDGISKAKLEELLKRIATEEPSIKIDFCFASDP